jgi:hypothetical protein
VGERTSRLPYPRALCASALALGAYVAGTPGGWRSAHRPAAGPGPAGAACAAGAAAPASGAPPSAPDEPAPFDPGDRTNVLAVLGLLEVDPVAVACIAAASAGLPASPSCSSAAPRSGGDDVGMFPINGAQSMVLVDAGAARMGVGAFFVGLARRSAAGGRRDIFAGLATPSRGYD